MSPAELRPFLVWGWLVVPEDDALAVRSDKLALMAHDADEAIQCALYGPDPTIRDLAARDPAHVKIGAVPLPDLLLYAPPEGPARRFQLFTMELPAAHAGAEVVA